MERRRTLGEVVDTKPLFEEGTTLTPLEVELLALRTALRLLKLVLVSEHGMGLCEAHAHALLTAEFPEAQRGAVWTLACAHVSLLLPPPAAGAWALPHAAVDAVAFVTCYWSLCRRSAADKAKLAARSFKVTDALRATRARLEAAETRAVTRAARRAREEAGEVPVGEADDAESPEETSIC